MPEQLVSAPLEFKANSNRCYTLVDIEPATIANSWELLQTVMALWLRRAGVEYPAPGVLGVELDTGAISGTFLRFTGIGESRSLWVQKLQPVWPLVYEINRPALGSGFIVREWSGITGKPIISTKELMLRSETDAGVFEQTPKCRTDLLVINMESWFALRYTTPESFIKRSLELQRNGSLVLEHVVNL